jgi:hypothetical protein
MLVKIGGEQINYIEETLKFIESEQMRESLRAWSIIHDRNRCGQIITCAPASLEIKISALELIAEQTEYNPEKLYHEPVILAKHARLALDELYNTSPGTVFLLEVRCNEDEHGQELFTTFKAIKNISITQ